MLIKHCYFISNGTTFSKKFFTIKGHSIVTKKLLFKLVQKNAQADTVSFPKC